jgi:hypothetical protein
MAEKLAWGYEDTEPDLVEAYKQFRQAGELGRMPRIKIHRPNSIAAS